jgi:hypothetical protein
MITRQVINAKFPRRLTLIPVSEPSHNGVMSTQPSGNFYTNFCGKSPTG